MEDAVRKEKSPAEAGGKEFWFTVEIQEIWVRTVRVRATDKEAARLWAHEGQGEGIEDDQFDYSSPTDPETWVVKRETPRDTDRRTLKIGIVPGGSDGEKKVQSE